MNDRQFAAGLTDYQSRDFWDMRARQERINTIIWLVWCFASVGAFFLGVWMCGCGGNG